MLLGPTASRGLRDKIISLLLITVLPTGFMKKELMSRKKSMKFISRKFDSRLNGT